MIQHQLDARIKRILQELDKLIIRTSTPVAGIRIAPKGSADFVPFDNGGVWATDAEWWDFAFTLRVPEGYSGRVVLNMSTGREAMWEAVHPQFVVRVNGRVEQAFDTKHTVMTLQTSAKPGEVFDVVLNAYSGISAEHPMDPPKLHLSLDDINEELRQLTYDIGVPHQAAILLKEGERERETTLAVLSEAIDMLDLRAPHSAAFDASVQKARRFLKREYYDKRAALPSVAVAEAVGHTHIDVAWLWDLEQTRHKAVRSFATMLKLMELYPEYKFMSSQAQLYSTVKQDEPEMFERIKQQVKAGRWEVEGGMWVEADCNLAGGESLVRQFLIGQQFFAREFGVLSRILWLPDVFGYSAALPQILKQSGIDYFMTTKLSWSEFNLSPYDTFMWKGIDGSEVLTHFSPSRELNDGGHGNLKHFTTYNAMLNPSTMQGGWQRFQQKGLDDHFLVSYGYGDGGGGPTEWMMENGRRMHTPLPGTPVVRYSHALPFFRALQARVEDNPALPKWSGELYLEYHRGTYTAIGKNKRNNRKTEILVRDVELLRAQALKAASLPYPIEKLDALWQDILTLQFHDILPGSSIKKVYEDSDQIYARLRAELTQLKIQAQQALLPDLAGDVLAQNTLSFVRDDLIWFDAPAWVRSLRGEDGALYPVQFAQGRACAFVRGMRPMTLTPYFFSKEEPKAKPMKLSRKSFETPFFKGKFDRAMRIVSLVERRSGREIVKPGEALGKIVCYENKPHNFDAWDINIYYDRRHFPVDDLQSCEIVENGPVLAIVRVRYNYMDSVIDQDIVLYADIDRIDYKTSVDFKEKQYLLKAHFPVDVHYNEATYDIQYGNLKRATHKNTSWDVARFEVCAHKWADVSEDGFGVALLNDCKYGHSIDEHSMALTLLKSSTSPNPDGDQEQHEFCYSLMPHVGGWREAEVPNMAYRLNVEAEALAGAGGQGALAPFARVDAPGVLIESVKGAQDGKGIVVRLYEGFGRRSMGVRLELGFGFESAQLCDLLERPIAEAERDGQSLIFTIKPYEIKSFLIK